MFKNKVQPWPHSKLEVSLGYVRPYLKHPNQNTQKEEIEVEEGEGEKKEGGETGKKGMKGRAKQRT